MQLHYSMHISETRTTMFINMNLPYLAWNVDGVSQSVWWLKLRPWRSGIESRWGRDFPPVQTGPKTHPASCKMGTGSFPGVKCGRAVLLTTHHLPVPRSWNSRVIPLPTLWATPGLQRDHLTFYTLSNCRQSAPQFAHKISAIFRTSKM